MWNGFNALIVVLTIVDSLLCVFIIAEFSFVRSWQLSSVAYTQAYPHLIYPLSNMVVAASIFMTVVLGLERLDDFYHFINYNPNYLTSYHFQTLSISPSLQVHFSMFPNTSPEPWAQHFSKGGLLHKPCHSHIHSD